MKKIILLCTIYLAGPGIFAQNTRDGERDIYISQLSYYGEFILDFVVIENGRIISNPSFRIKYNKKKLKKIADKNLTPCINCKISYLNNENIYVNRQEYYTTGNFNNYLAEKFKANEGANFFNRLSHAKEAYLMACPDFFEMTNEERLLYFLDHMEK
jgi:hypothetical protein